MNLIRGATLLDCEVHGDERGELIVFEQTRNLPFLLQRVFFIRVDAPNIVRGGHANSCDELILAVNGSVSVEVDNGDERACIRLYPDDRALWVKPGVLISLREFDPRTVLMVCASAGYAQTRHFDKPQPRLLPADCLL